MSRLAILMCTYNTANFIQRQLDSILEQTFKDWTLFVYDDGSTDQTENFIQEFQKKCAQKCYFIKNKQRLGFARNFMNAVCQVPKEFDYFAFSDHDDIFLPLKFQDAIGYLEKIPAKTPGLYCTATTLIDANENVIGSSPLFYKPLSFKNALLQSIAGGNTMVFNKCAASIVSRVSIDCQIVSHDWLIYQIIMGIGGKAYYDTKPSLLYRQHSQNAVGSGKANFWCKIIRLKMLFDGQFKAFLDSNITALEPFYAFFTPESKKIMDTWVQLRSMPLYKRLLYFYKLGLHRQALLDNVLLYLALLFKTI